MSPLLALLLAPLPLMALANSLRIFPHRSLVLMALAPALLSITLLTQPQIFWPLMVLDVLRLSAAIVDLTSLPAKKTFSAERQAGRVASLKKPHRVTLTISNHSRRERLVFAVGVE